MSSLPHGIADALHIDEPFPIRSLLLAGLLAWLLYRFVRRVLAARPKAAEQKPTPSPLVAEPSAIGPLVEDIRERFVRLQSYRQGCHALAAALREHLHHRSEGPKTASPLTALTAVEIGRTIGDTAASRFFHLLADLQFRRRTPTRNDFEGACDLALGIARSPHSLGKAKS